MNFPKKLGYMQGLITIENCCDWAIKNKIKYLTIFCFSTENWIRTKEEIDLLMELARTYFVAQKNWYINKDISVHFSGRKDRLDKDILKKSQILEQDTKNGKTLTLTICIDYGSKDEIARAIAAGARTVEEIDSILTENFPDPDVILRTGGQHRLSNFLLWQGAYSELFFLDCLFPDLSDSDLDQVKTEFQKRKRTYGK